MTTPNENESDQPKYCLLQRGEAPNEDTLHVFDTRSSRDLETIRLIFGEDISTQDEAEQWDKMRDELNEKGVLTFEGDPGLEWFTAHLRATHEPKPDPKHLAHGNGGDTERMDWLEAMEDGGYMLAPKYVGEIHFRRIGTDRTFSAPTVRAVIDAARAATNLSEGTLAQSASGNRNDAATGNEAGGALAQQVHRITEEDQPVFPCWLWSPKTPDESWVEYLKWSADDPPATWGWTHWSPTKPDQPPKL